VEVCRGWYDGKVSKKMKTRSQVRSNVEVWFPEDDGGSSVQEFASTRTTTGARQTGFFETCSTMPAATHGAAIMLAVLAAAHERRQAPPYGRVDTNKTIYDDHFSM
jgi:hypothetical protein